MMDTKNERDAAIEQAWKRFCGTYYDNHETVPVLYRTAIQMGFDAASVSRREVVEEAMIERAKKFLDLQTYGNLLPETRLLWTAWLVGFAKKEIEIQENPDGK
jgi:hypothetical protein